MAVQLRAPSMRTLGIALICVLVVVFLIGWFQSASKSPYEQYLDCIESFDITGTVTPEQEALCRK